MEDCLSSCQLSQAIRLNILGAATRVIWRKNHRKAKKSTKGEKINERRKNQRKAKKSAKGKKISETKKLGHSDFLHLYLTSLVALIRWCENEKIRTLRLSSPL